MSPQSARNFQEETEKNPFYLGTTISLQIVFSIQEAGRATDGRHIDRSIDNLSFGMCSVFSFFAMNFADGMDDAGGVWTKFI